MSTQISHKCGHSSCHYNDESLIDSCMSYSEKGVGSSSQVENDLFETSTIEQNKNKHLRLTQEANVQADQNTFTLPIKATHISVFNEIMHFLGPGMSTLVIA